LAVGCFSLKKGDFTGPEREPPYGAWPPSNHGSGTPRLDSGISAPKPNTHARLICCDDGDLNHRYEIDVSLCAIREVGFLFQGA
jgi:hypothetical protein